MKIIEASAAIINPFETSGLALSEFAAKQLGHIEWCGRISHRSEDTTPNTETFLRRVVLEHGDWSITEHSQLSVDVFVDRGITHEWVRHRLFSFTQESTRFVNYMKKMPPSFIYPQVEGEKAVRCPHCLAGIAAVREGEFCGKVLWSHALTDGAKVLCNYDADWLDAIDFSEQKYQALLKKGWRPQEARSVFPTGLAARIVCTANLRNWRHFFLSRTSKEAHPQIRQVATKLLNDFKTVIPVLYEDIQPGQRQIDNFKLPR